MTTHEQPACLTIAGLDPSGGAGVVADIRAFTSYGCYAAAVVTALTFQNTRGVLGAVPQSGTAVRDQLRPVLDDIEIVAAKTGMLPSRDVIAAVAEEISAAGITNFVVDPVVRSTSGFDLIDDHALTALVALLFPLSIVVTPNIAEAERISRLSINSIKDVTAAGEKFLELGARSVLIKGGHAIADDEGFAVDRLFDAEGMVEFRAPRIETTSTHGTGCVLSAAITAGLAMGNDLRTSIDEAKQFVTRGIENAPKHGKGNSPVNSGLFRGSKDRG